MAVLYSKFFFGLMRCFPCLPQTYSLRSLTFLQFAPLSSSSSFPSKPSLNVVSDFLTRDCGFSSSQVTTVMRRYPLLLRTKSDQTAREAIRILKDFGLTENQLRSTIVRNPTILALKVDDQLKPKMEFLKSLGLGPIDTPRLISRNPRLLSMSLKNSIAPKILPLETLLGSKEHLRKALRRSPQFLTCDFQKQVIPRAEYVNNYLSIEEGSATFVNVVSVLLHVSFETLEMKTKYLASLGLSEEEIRLLLRRFPRVLEGSTKKLKENMDFLTHTAGLMPEVVASRPFILTFSVEKTLKPRYEFFEYLRTNPNFKCPISLVNFLSLSEKDYLKKIGQYSPPVKSDHTIS